MLPLIISGLVAASVLAYMLLASRPGGYSQQRRFPRLDLAVPVAIYTHESRYAGETRNISQGGMLLIAPAPVAIAQPIRLRFSLPTVPAETQVEIPAVVSYKKGEQIGVRFDPTHHTRADLERWIAQTRMPRVQETPGSVSVAGGNSES